MSYRALAGSVRALPPSPNPPTEAFRAEALALDRRIAEAELRDAPGAANAVTRRNKAQESQRLLKVRLA